MNNPQDRPNRSKRPFAVLLTITLHLALAYFLYTQAVKASDGAGGPHKQEQVETKTP
jgi:hypothetical protein